MLRKAFIGYTIIILLMAVLPINGPGSALNNNYILEIRLDYVAHFAIYIPWMILVWLYSGVTFYNSPARAFAWVSSGIALSVISEGVQYFLPYRAFNINDLIANLAGVLLGSLAFFIKRRD